LRRKAVNHYFKERCSGGAKNKDLYTTLKPFLSKKNSDKSGIILLENDRILNKQEEVANTLNRFYTSMAENIGRTSSPQDAASVIMVTPGTSLSFSEVSSSVVEKKLKSLNTKKATGKDNIPPKLLRCGAEVLAPPMCIIVNKCIAEGVFPEEMKMAVVTPVFKKKDPLDKANYRPVSILSTTSKIFEGVIADQLNSYFESIFSPYLCAFRKGFSCQTLLLRMIEDWKKSLDDKKTVGAVLIDLSKAFDSRKTLCSKS
jgi:hypothetical protein